MTQRTFVGTAARALVVTSGLLAFTALAPSAAWAGFPCVDVNGDGACEAGVDTDISREIAENGFYATDGHLVLPSNVSVRGDLSLAAGGNITVGGKIKAQSVSLSAGGAITMSEKAALKGEDYVDLSSQGPVTIGAGGQVNSGNGTVYVWSWGGGLFLGPDVKVAATYGIDLSAMGGNAEVLESQLAASKGEVSLTAAGDIVLTGTTTKGQWVSVRSDASLIDFREGVVKLKGKDGSVLLYTAGSTVNLSGTKFKNVPESALYIDAEEVIR